MIYVEKGWFIFKRLVPQMVFDGYDYSTMIQEKMGHYREGMPIPSSKHDGLSMISSATSTLSIHACEICPFIPCWVFQRRQISAPFTILMRVFSTFLNCRHFLRSTAILLSRSLLLPGYSKRSTGFRPGIALRQPTTSGSMESSQRAICALQGLMDADTISPMLAFIQLTCKEQAYFQPTTMSPSRI